MQVQPEFVVASGCYYRERRDWTGEENKEQELFIENCSNALPLFSVQLASADLGISVALRSRSCWKFKNRFG